jgi:hypothetical protein
METSDRGWNYATRTEALGLVQPNLLQPSSVERYLLRCIRVSSVGQIRV